MCCLHLIGRSAHSLQNAFPPLSFLLIAFPCVLSEARPSPIWTKKANRLLSVLKASPMCPLGSPLKRKDLVNLLSPFQSPLLAKTSASAARLDSWVLSHARPEAFPLPCRCRRWRSRAGSEGGGRMWIFLLESTLRERRACAINKYLYWLK